MSVCFLDDMVLLGVYCASQEPLSQTVKPGIWTRLEIAETLCHLDMETNKSMLPSGEDRGNFWGFYILNNEMQMKCDVNRGAGLNNFCNSSYSFSSIYYNFLDTCLLWVLTL